MKFLTLSLGALAFHGYIAHTQITWSGQVAEVFYNNCTQCHNPNGIGPFSLMDYTSAYDYQSLIQTAVLNNEMPPWTADTAYQHYFHERILTQTERDLILDWIGLGAPSGDLVAAPPPPVYNGEQILPGVPDLIVTMPDYTSKATSTQDDYACFTVPSGLLANRKIKAIEVIPGNHAIVHHCLVYADADGSYLTDSIGLDCGGPTDEPLIGAYTPGASPTIFPATGSFSSGMTLSAGSDIVFAMHYPAGSFGEHDQTRVHIYFYPEPVANFREVYAVPVLEDWAFTIYANTIDTVESVYPAIAGDITMLSVFPHMHLLGKYIESYAVTPANDTLRFVRIPQWDFHWQEFYFFKYLQYVPAGSDIRGIGIYDNTSANLNNPNSPPQNVSAGFNTTDEMFMIFYHFMLYEPGDEFINVDSLNTIFLSEKYNGSNDSKVVHSFPNPFSDYVTLGYSLSADSYVSIFIYNQSGKLVRRLVHEHQLAGYRSVVWDGNDESGNKVSSGLYHYSVLINGVHSSGTIVLAQSW